MDENDLFTTRNVHSKIIIICTHTMNEAHQDISAFEKKTHTHTACKKPQQLNNDITLCITLSWMKSGEYKCIYWLWLLSPLNKADTKCVHKTNEWTRVAHSTLFTPTDINKRFGKGTIKKWRWTWLIVLLLQASAYLNKEEERKKRTYNDRISVFFYDGSWFHIQLFQKWGWRKKKRKFSIWMSII